MIRVVFYFQVHQPFRLRHFTFFDIGSGASWFDDSENSRIVRRVAERCYLPANRLMLELIEEHEGEFRVAYSISGTALDQFERWAPEVTRSFRELVDTGCVEILGETSHHSLASQASLEEFDAQVLDHAARIEALFGRRPTTFRNTELVISNRIARRAEELGFTAILGEGADQLLGWRSPHRVYRPEGCERIKLLLRSYRFSDDIAFRFSNKEWPEYPLKPERFAEWLAELGPKEKLVGLFMDYETFGEHQWEETGIFRFLRGLPEACLETGKIAFRTPAEIVAELDPVARLDIPHAVSWADAERDLTAWLGNPMQKAAHEALYELLPDVVRLARAGRAEPYRRWRMLSTSDHVYYMCTKWFSDGDVHKYFSPYATPHDAFISFMNVLDDLAREVRAELAACNDSLPPIHGLTVTFTLFEVSWEVCNKVGGIHTVVSTKAKTLVQRFGDEYVTIGPWLLGTRDTGDVFEEQPGFESFAQSCRELGLPVRVGRWKIPSRPRAVLIEFSSLYAKKNDILGRLWEKAGVDSITGGWDYDEPVLFGWAAGIVIERWCQEYVARSGGLAVAQFHEWMTGSGLLYLGDKAPAVGTVFTTHATVLGRSLAHGGAQPLDGLKERTPDQAANDLGVRSKHSMESACAKHADVFTTVSEITAREAELLLGRKPEPILPNGIDLQVVDELAGEVLRDGARAKVLDISQRFLGRSAHDAALLVLSGRYEFHNKGIDLLLEALAKIDARPGKPIVQLLLVPAAQSGLIQPLRQRLESAQPQDGDPLGVSTHNLIDREKDPIQSATQRLGLVNRPDQRVKVVQVPIYLHPSDGFLDLPYEAVLRATDFSVFPSFYEPWGYTPEESLALGVPTVTTDLAGFGAWARDQGLTQDDGVWVLPRAGSDDARAAEELSVWIERFVAEELGRPGIEQICRRTAERTAWTGLIARYNLAFETALERARSRAEEHPMLRFRPRVAMPVAPIAEAKRPRLFAFEVSATLPKELAGLERLARNFYWSWDPDAASLFEEISPVGWASSGHNPVLFLRLVFPEDLAAKAQDARFIERLTQALSRFDEYVAARDRQSFGCITPEHPVAYFSAEFGVHESLRIYSGGLGILAGDHLKSASDLELPLVGVGLFYRAGYLRQRITASGEQIALEAENDPRSMALELARDDKGQPIEITLQLPSTLLTLRAWRAQIGRVELYLLDANLEKNRPEDRTITHQLYAGDQELRLRQEIVLGRGGVRLLEALGLRPSVFHINEGHAAFLVLARCASLIREHGLTFDEARELVRATTVFTTHTPVPAGHDRFGEDVMRRYFSDVENWLGVKWERFMSLGASEEDKSAFNMTYLALSCAGFVNGVSKLHGEVSKELLRPFWPSLLKTEVPVHSITNGVHLSSWMAPGLQRLCGAGVRPVRGDQIEESAERIDRAELWRVRSALRARLLKAARENLERAFVERNDSPSLLARSLAGLDERALLVGFARRFAPYKRSNLLFHDLERLRALLDDEKRPMRVFFAGKAHPRDGQGQEILRQVVELSRRDEFVGRVFFFEDYDIELARALVQGVDVWLNNPIRMLEASGTSGMKAAANGVLNLSIPDGWWVEGFDGQNGWNVGDGRVWHDPALQDELDSQSIVRLLADEVLPLYFERDEQGVPQRWLERAQQSLATIPPFFNTDRMVGEYRDQAYGPMSERWFELTGEGCEPLRQMAGARERIRKHFGEVKIVDAQVSDLTGLRVGDAVEARVRIDLAGLEPDDVQAELLFGHSKDGVELRNPIQVRLTPSGAREGNLQLFRGSQRVSRSGAFAYGLRVRAKGANDLVIWA